MKLSKLFPSNAQIDITSDQEGSSIDITVGAKMVYSYFVGDRTAPESLIKLAAKQLISDALTNRVALKLKRLIPNKKR